MIHPSTELFERRDLKGYGVRATANIPMGTLLWVRDPLDIALDPHEVAALRSPLREEVDRLGYMDRAGRTIVCWDAGRYVNHRCQPTMRSVGEDAMVAIANVEVGEEITCDYAECNLSVPLQCLCGTSDCRGSVSGNNLRRHAERVRAWDEDVKRAMHRAGEVDQPLLVHACARQFLADVLSGARDVPTLVDVLRAEEMECAAR